MDDAKLLARINELFDVDIESGRMFWKVKKKGTKGIGKEAGSHTKNDYCRITIDYRTYSRHRLLFLVAYGFLPEQVDHINGIRGDDRAENLRAATSTQNQMNKCVTKSNTSGYKGVCFDKSRGKYMASIRVKGKTKTIGRFETAELASASYEESAKIHFGEFNPKSCRGDRYAA